MRIPKHKSKIVIIEGPDCAGKSTFVEHMKSRWVRHWGDEASIFHVHKGPPKHGNSADSEYKLPLYEFVVNHGYDEKALFIADRWHLGEQIYGPLLRNECMYDMEWFFEFESQLTEANAIRIILLPPMAILMERYDLRGDSFITKEQLYSIVMKYIDFAIDNKHQWNTCRPDNDARMIWLSDLYLGLFNSRSSL